MSCWTSFRSRFFVAIVPSVLLPHSRTDGRSHVGASARDPCPHQALTDDCFGLLSKLHLRVPVADDPMLLTNYLARLSRDVALSKLLGVCDHGAAGFVDGLVRRCREALGREGLDRRRHLRKELRAVNVLFP